MILVTGATGNVGGEIVNALVARGEQVRALVRDPSRTTLPATVEIATGDLAAPSTLAAALDGIAKVFLLAGFPTMPEILRRAETAGVDHVALLTSRCVVGGNPANAITRMWLDAERVVREAAIPWTILRPSGLHSNALRWRPQLRRGDVVRAPWPYVPIASIDPGDIAAVAATILTEGGHQGTTPSLSGPQALTVGEQIDTLARVLRRPLRFEPLDDDEARVAMADDTPVDFIDGFFRFFADGEFDDSPVVDTVQQITGNSPCSFQQWAERQAHAFYAP